MKKVSGAAQASANHKEHEQRNQEASPESDVSHFPRLGDVDKVLRVNISGTDIITVYRSEGYNVPELALKVQELIDECGEDARIVIVGDLNFPGDEVNNFTYVLSRRGFKQIVKEPTHLGGRCIDHCYVKDPANVQLFLHAVYYSDHTALCITLR